jgi:hypothetical protein
MLLAVLRPCIQVWYIFWTCQDKLRCMVKQIIGKLSDERFQLLIVQCIHLLYQQFGSASEVGITFAHASPSFHVLGGV